MFNTRYGKKALATILLVLVVLSGSSCARRTRVVYVDRTPRTVVVEPAATATIITLPPEAEPYVVEGVTYYRRGGVYYQSTPRGYIVVSEPRVVVHPRGRRGRPVVGVGVRL